MDGLRPPLALVVRPQMQMRRILMIFMLAALAACRSQDSAAVANNFLSSDPRGVDLSVAVRGEWDRVCVLGPYSNDTKAADILGFSWPAETLTDISHSDAISVLVFARDESVVTYVEHSRGYGDFSNLSGRCFAKDRAKFVHIDRPVTGWPGLFPADEV